MSDMRREFGYLSILSRFVVQENKKLQWKLMERSSFLLFWELLINYNKLTTTKKLDAVDKIKQTPGPWSGTWLKQQYMFGITILFSVQIQKIHIHCARSVQLNNFVNFKQNDCTKIIWRRNENWNNFF